MDPALAVAVARDARLHVRAWDLDLMKVRLLDLSVSESELLDVDALLEVRRPVSYKGMKRYIGRMSVPSRTDGEKGVWFDSRNEHDHYRDLLLSLDVVEMTTQPLRFDWIFSDGLRSHVPDALLLLGDGSRLLIDVTRDAKLSDPKTRATFTLTAATCDELGWRYEVRTELSPQHVSNVSAIWSCRWARPQQARAWREQAEAVVGLQVWTAATVLGGGNPTYAGIWHLVANQVLALPLADPIRLDSTIGAGRRIGQWPL